MAPVVYLVRDLFFAARIRDTAGHLGLETASAADAEGLHAAARGAALVILDLRLPDSLRALDLLAADPATARVPSIGFIDHEQVETMRAATDRGCARVLSKRKFSQDLPELLASGPAAPAR